MNWHVFNRDDPETWPEIDCPLLVCWTDGEKYRLYNAKWDKEDKQFVRDLRWIVFYKGDIFYTYIDYIPYIEKELHPAKCKDNRYLCSHYDDGYCLGEDTKCKGIEIVTEYSIRHKRIWKEFGED